MTAYQFLATLVVVSLALSVIMMGAWLVWRGTRNSGWIDTVWTFGLGLVGFATAIQAPGNTQRATLVGFLILIWAIRLGLHIANRTAKITDDPRYARLVQSWGEGARAQMFWLLQKQALVSIPLAMSVSVAAWNPAPGLLFQDFLGAAILVVAIGGEALADVQLTRFRGKARNEGRICDAGLWRWSRHPNYFFEWFGWLAYPLIAIDWSGTYSWGFAALLGPLCMYWLLVHVSGIPPLEEHMVQKHGQAFRDYQASTNAFFPAPPREA